MPVQTTTKTKNGSAKADPWTTFEQFQDFLAPRLDVYEQAIYLYALRHSRLVGRRKVRIEFKLARQQIARGPGKRATPLAASTCYEKLKSLAAKGCVQLLDRRREGPDVRVMLPSEVPGLISLEHKAALRQLEQTDFYNVPQNRRLILERDNRRCFYCLKKLNDSSYTIDHVAARPSGNDSYRNVVASCRTCNNRKGESAAEDLLRVLYREGYVGADDLSDRLTALQELRDGHLKPGLEVTK